MSSKQHVDEQKLDALLRAWPALDDEGRALPADGDMAWDERADAIVAAARAATTDQSAVERALGAPNLPAEPGEPGQVNPAFRAGELSMSDSEGSAGSKPPPSLSPSSAGPSSMPRPRQSLREIAERASQSGRAAMPSSPTATPLPGRASQPSSPAVRSPLPSSPAATKPASAAATPVPSPSRRPVEAGSADSGIVDLNIINAAADATARAAAEKAKPAEASLFDDDAPASKPAAAAAVASKDKAKDKAKVVAIAKATPAAPAKSGGGAMIGIVIALVGVAAAFAIWQVRKGASGPTAHEDTPKAAVTAEAPKPEATAAAKPEAVAKAEATAAEDQGLDPSALPDEQRAAAARRAGRVPGPLPKAAETAAPSAVAAAEPAPKKGSAVGSLNEEMQKATGTDGKSKGGDGEPEFAGGDTRSKTLPEHPSPGAVQAAIGAVLGAAKACVSEADEATRAQVTFKPSGAVASVTVTGWASANGKSGCVVSALKGAKVGAFTDASYSFPVSIRP